MSVSRHRLFSAPIFVIALLTVLSLATTRFAVARDTTTVTSNEPAPTTLTLSGRGTVAVQPDTASVSLGITIEDETLGAAQDEATATMTRIFDAISDAGIQERDIRTVDYRVDIVYDYDDDGTVTAIIGYQVSNTVNATVREIDSVGGILDAVVAAGANTVYGISFFVEDTAAAASQARTAAVADAMAKADEIAAAAGLQVSRIVSIYESSSPPPSPVDFDDAEGIAEGASSSVPLQAGTTEITADIDVVFELEAAG